MVISNLIKHSEPEMMSFSQPVKNYSIQEVTQLAGVKNIPIEKICSGYKIDSLSVASQPLLNTIYNALLKK